MDAGNGGSSVTLIFYRIQPEWWREPVINILAAACQQSNLTHVEIAIGEQAGSDGLQIGNVCRVFNDAVGVELVDRTGRNPLFTYLQLGCSKAAERAMLHFARTKCVGKPFSQYGMARSLVWPRQTDGESYFCAELVCAILKEGGLIDRTTNPGAATPQNLFELYSPLAAAAANPCTLREFQFQSVGASASASASAAPASGMLAAGSSAEHAGCLTGGASGAPGASGGPHAAVQFRMQLQALPGFPNGGSAGGAHANAHANASAHACASLADALHRHGVAGGGSGATSALATHRRSDSPPRARFKAIAGAGAGTGPGGDSFSARVGRHMESNADVGIGRVRGSAGGGVGVGVGTAARLNGLTLNSLTFSKAAS